MMNQFLRHGIPALVVFLFMTAGCTLSQKKAEVRPETAVEDLPVTVAILPFENRTKDPGAAGVVRKSVFNQFAAKRYRDIDLHLIDAALAREGIPDPADFTEIPPERLGRILGAQGLLYGVVTSYDTLYVGAYSNVTVALEATLIDARTGQTLWQKTHKTGSHEGGIPLDPFSAIPTLFRTLYNISDMQKTITCDKLARTLMASMPEPAAGQTFQGPVIELLAHDAGNGWKKAGDDITVSLKGEPGMAAAFDIGESITQIRMEEVEDGIYKGVYQVRPGDMADNAMITARLMDGSGRASAYVDPIGLINIDTLPPAPLKTVTARSRDQSVRLEWEDAREPDLTGYRIYRSLSPRTGFQPIARTEQPFYTDPGLEYFQAYHYRVAGVDRAGNESEPSPPVSAVPVPPGPTLVSSDITGDTVWYSQASPYVLEKTVTVQKGAALTIAAGSRIQSPGPGLVVKGRLTAAGTPDHPIRFSGMTSDGKKPAWDGIRFDSTDRVTSIVQHCRIQDAHTALALISASFEISCNLITENIVGIDIRDFSSPNIVENRIVHNTKTGIQCRRSAPVIEKNVIQHNLTGGITVLSGTPQISKNAIHDNIGFDLSFAIAGHGVLAAPDNWWGTTNPETILDKIRGPVVCSPVLDASWPDGTSIVLAEPDQVEPEIAKAFQQMENRKYSDARQLLYQILAAAPDHGKANFLAGLIHHRRGNLQKALDHVTAATRADPKNIDYLYTLGMLEMESGNMKAALVLWQKVVEKDPAHTRARNLLMIYQ